MKTNLVKVEKEREMSGREDAPALRLRRDREGSLTMTRDGQEAQVYPHLCFPWTAPCRYISLRDREKNEKALLENVLELDPESRAALEEVMAEARFVFSITGIHSAQAEFELRVWKVQTQQGERQFQTKLDDWPRPLPDGGLLIRDIGGDLYRVENPHDLDAASRRILWAFMD